jgi:hypothetical protein
MKKIIYCAALIIGFNSFVQAQLPITIYGGLNFAGVSSKDFNNFDISDWENYGLLSTDPFSAEGRVKVDLNSMKPKGINLGIMLGGRYQLNEKLSALAEVQYSLSKVSLLGLYAGINYDFVKGEKFSLGITPKIGYNVGSIDLGVISLIPGYTPPVILPQGTFNVDDALSMEFSGLAVNLGLTPNFAVTEKISITGFLGYNLSFAKSDGLLCNGILMPMTARGVVKSDGLNTQAGISPTVKSSGLNFQLGVAYTLGSK